MESENLLELIKKNNEFEIKKLIENEPNIINGYKGNILVDAIDENVSKNIIKLLIENKAQTNIEGYIDQETPTPLDEALMHGRPDIVKLLVENNKSFNPNDESVFYALVRCGKNKGMLDLLMSYNVDINMKNDESYTPLIKASRYRYDDSILLLIENGANINDINGKGRNALFEYIDKQYINIDIVIYLIRKGSDINIIDNKGDTPLIVSSRRGNVDVVEVLIENEADTNIKNNKGENALIAFSSISNVNKVNIPKFLINGDIEINEADKYGKTALMYASQHQNNYNVVEYLIEKGANINLIDKEGNNALIISAKFSDNKTFKILLSKGSDISIVNKESKNAKFYAERYDPEKFELINSYEFFINEINKIVLVNEKYITIYKNFYNTINYILETDENFKNNLNILLSLSEKYVNEYFSKNGQPLKNISNLHIIFMDYFYDFLKNPYNDFDNIFKMLKIFKSILEELDIYGYFDIQIENDVNYGHLCDYINSNKNDELFELLELYKEQFYDFDLYEKYYVFHLFRKQLNEELCLFFQNK